MVEALTQGILVRVESIYIESQSDPDEPRYVFAYNVHIENQGNEPATLKTRHWVISDARGKSEEVRGPGVVGETPRLEAGTAHAYQSFSVLLTARGTMHGSYQMERDDGESFEVTIPTFVLSTLKDDSKMILN